VVSTLEFVQLSAFFFGTQLETRKQFFFSLKKSWKQGLEKNGNKERRTIPKGTAAQRLFDPPSLATPRPPHHWSMIPAICQDGGKFFTTYLITYFLCYIKAILHT